MNKKVALALIITTCLLVMVFPQLNAQLRQNVQQETYLDLDDPWPVNGTLKLEWDKYTWRTVRFWDSKGFVIASDNVVLDLNGHTVLMQQTTLGPGPTGIEAIGKSNVVIRNGTIIGFQYGIFVADSRNVDIISNTVVNNMSFPALGSIEIRNSSNVNMFFNTVSGSGDVGIGVDSNSEKIIISNNNVSRSGREGIYLKDSNNINIVGNTVSRNGYYGIHIYNSQNNTINNNTVSDNDPNGGIYMDKVFNTTIMDNTISNNPEALDIENSVSNLIYHNDFINNSKGVESHGSTNKWDTGYGGEKDISYGGNYWDDYNGTDKYCGKNQNISGSDGIGDAPYGKDSDNLDRYPLMNRWGSMLQPHDVLWQLFDPVKGWTNKTCTVATFTNSSLNGFNFDRVQKQISFNTTGGTFCNIVIPETVLGGSFQVSINGVQAPSVTSWDETYYFIQLDLSNTTQRVKIAAETSTGIVGDLNGDGEVNIVDIAMAAANYGRKTR